MLIQRFFETTIRVNNSLPTTKTHQWSSRMDRLRWSHAALILLALFAAANWQLLTGRAYEKWDAFDLASPYYSLLADYARAGRFFTGIRGSRVAIILGSQLFLTGFVAELVARNGSERNKYQVEETFN